MVREYFMNKKDSDLSLIFGLVACFYGMSVFIGLSNAKHIFASTFIAGWFYGMSVIIGLFDIKVSFFLPAILWLTDFMT